jgi:hypothetical protein
MQRSVDLANAVPRPAKPARHDVRTVDGFFVPVPDPRRSLGSASM